MCDGPKAYHDEYRLARKPHKCCECGGTIFYKERYHIFTGIWDDNWQTFKTCNDCMEIRNDYQKQLAWDEQPNFEELRDYIFDGNYKPDIQKFIDNCDKRGKLVPKWMREHLRTCKKK